MDEVDERPVRSLAQSLIPAVYNELRRLAQGCLRGERAGHTLQPTALVHEAYLRLVSQHPGVWGDRARFVGTAAHLMRQILVDYARSRRRDKRGGPHHQRVPLHEAMAVVDSADAQPWEDLDRALEKLARLSPRQTRIVELRYFGGLTIDETASVMGLSEKTVKRDWAVARAWLRRELSTSPTASSDDDLFESL